MPSGYTAPVRDGEVVELDDFVLKCARAFGACIMQRDDPIDDAPKMEEVSDYHSNALKKAEKELAQLKVKSRDELLQDFFAAQRAALESYEKDLKEKSQAELRYRSMIEKVEGWQPPSPDHEGLKEFMLKQLNDSIEWDCNTGYYKDQLERIQEMTFESWYAEELKAAEWDVEYHGREYKEEVERVENRNKWKQQLYESLGVEV